MASKKRIALFTGLAILISVIGTIFVFEMLLRWIPLTRDNYCPLFQADPDYKYHYKPEQSLTTLFGKRIRFNRFGLRNSTPYELKKSSETYRILILGDSVGVGLNVDDNDIYTAYLNEKIRAQKGEHVELVNGSCEGYNTFNELAWYTKVGRQFTPNEVWLLYVSNDLSTKPNNFYVSKEGYSTQNPQAFLPLWFRFQLRKSALFVFLYSRLTSLSRNEQSVKELEGLHEPSRKVFLNLVQEVSEITTLKVFFLPRRPALEQEILPKPYNWLESICLEYGIPFYDITPSLKRLKETGIDPFLPYDPVHLSVAGHKVLAEVMNKNFNN